MEAFCVHVCKRGSRSKGGTNDYPTGKEKARPLGCHPETNLFKPNSARWAWKRGPPHLFCIGHGYHQLKNLTTRSQIRRFKACWGSLRRARLRINKDPTTRLPPKRLLYATKNPVVQVSVQRTFCLRALRSTSASVTMMEGCTNPSHLQCRQAI